MSGDRTKFKYESKLIYGLHPEGIFEIKIHDPKKKNAVFKKSMTKMAELLEFASKSEEVKCVVVHGGEIFTVGNDVEAFQIGREDVAFIDKMVKDLLRASLMRLCHSLLDLEKPLIMVPSGLGIGLGFTMISFADFVYCTPETTFFTPFMQSFQSPEGASTAYFPEIFGRRKANEILLLDSHVKAKDALKYGFITGILEGTKPKEWPDLLALPCMPKLL